MPDEGAARLVTVLLGAVYFFIATGQTHRDRFLQVASVVIGAGFCLGALWLGGMSSPWWPPLLVACAALFRDRRWQPTDTERLILLVTISVVIVHSLVPAGVRLVAADGVADLTHVVGRHLIREPYPNLSASFGGIYLAACVVPFMLWSLAIRPRSYRRVLVVLCTLALIIGLVYVVNYLFAAAFVLAVAVAGLVPEGTADLRTVGASTTLGPGIRVAGGSGVAALVVIAVVGGFERLLPPDPGDRRVAFRDSAMADQDMYEHGKYGAAALPDGAQFGVFRKLMLPHGGWEEVTPDALLAGNRGVYVVINPEASFGTVEHARIWGFVARGGSLLVLGDHTDIGGTRGPLNQLLEPVGIAFNFDSAMPLDAESQWFNCIDRYPHPALTRER
jgi:hypothetical protein